MKIFLNSHIEWIPSQLITTLAYCLLSNDIYDYRIVSQGKTTIPSVDDGAEFEDTDVRIGQTNFLLISFCCVFVIDFSLIMY